MPELSERIVARIEAETVQLRREMTRAQRTVRKGSRDMERSLGRTDRAFEKLGKGLKGLGVTVGVAAAAAAVAKLSAEVREAVSELAALSQTAEKLGQSTDLIQEMRFAADAFGVAANQADLGLQRFTRRVAEAAQGSGELKDTLDQYNIAVKNADGSTRAAEDVLGDLADAIQGADSEAEQLRIAFKAFDSEGVALVSVLRKGSEGFNRLRQKAHDAGEVIGADLVGQARDMDQIWSLISGKIHSRWISALVRFAEALRGVFDVRLESWMRDSQSLRAELIKLEMQIATVTESMETAFDTGAKPGSDIIDTLSRELSALRAFEGEIRDELKSREAVEKESGAAAEEALRKRQAAVADHRSELDRFMAAQVEATRLSKLDTEARQEEILVMRGRQSAMADNNLLSAQSERALRKLIKARRDATKAQELASEAAELNAQHEADAIERAADRQKQALEDVDRTAGRFASTVTDGLRFARREADSLGEAFENMGKKLLELLEEILIFEPLEAGLRQLLGGQASGGTGGGIFGGFLGGLFGLGGDIFGSGSSPSPGITPYNPDTGGFPVIPGGVSGPFPLPGLARGGHLEAGQAAIVGEDGPEPFIPDVAGTVIPFRRGGTGGGLTQVITVDARGAGEHADAIIAEAVRLAVNEAMRRSEQSANEGGSFARAMGRR